MYKRKIQHLIIMQFEDVTMFIAQTTTSSEKPITEAPHLHESPPPPYHEATATTTVDTKCNDKQQFDV